MFDIQSPLTIKICLPSD